MAKDAADLYRHSHSITFHLCRFHHRNKSPAILLRPKYIRKIPFDPRTIQINPINCGPCQWDGCVCNGRFPSTFTGIIGDLICCDLYGYLSVGCLYLFFRKLCGKVVEFFSVSLGSHRFSFKFASICWTCVYLCCCYSPSV